MITVEWNDFHAPRGPDNKVAVRHGVLLQAGMAMLKGERDPHNVAFVITDWIATDTGNHKGAKVVLPVRLAEIRVKGTRIPLFNGD